MNNHFFSPYNISLQQYRSKDSVRYQNIFWIINLFVYTHAHTHTHHFQKLFWSFSQIEALNPKTTKQEEIFPSWDKKKLLLLIDLNTFSSPSNNPENRFQVTVILDSSRFGYLVTHLHLWKILTDTASFSKT